MKISFFTKKFILFFFGVSIIITLFFGYLLHPVFAATGINQQINFQGKLVKSDGTNVPDGTYTVVFNIYDAASSGTSFWAETDTVTTRDGIFRVALGATTAIPANINFNWDGMYLGMQVTKDQNNSNTGDAEMTPRIRFTGVPYAFNSQKVAGLTVQDTSGNASTSGTLQIANNKTVSFGDAFTTTAGNALTLTTSGVTTVTLPTSGTLATITGTENLTNKTINGIAFTSSTIKPNAAGGLAIDANGSNTLSLGVNDGNAINIGKTGTSITVNGLTSNQSSVLYLGSSGALSAASTTALSQQCLLSSGAATGIPVWATCPSGGSSGLNYWIQTSGIGVTNGGYTALGNLTTDLLVGGLATSSAKFAVLNVNSGTPVASVSAQTGAANSPSLVLSSSGSIQSVANNTLTVGGATTGDIQFKPGNSGSSLYLASNGNVGVGINAAGTGIKLNVLGDSLFTGNSTITGTSTFTGHTTISNFSSYYGFTNTTGADSFWQIFSDNSTGAYAGANGIAIFGGDTPSTKLAITSSGSIGVNTPNPLASFDVRPALANGGTLAVASVSGSTSFAGFVVDNSGTGDLFTASSSGLTRFVITQAGNVGIGTTSATTQLTVQGVGNSTASQGSEKITNANDRGFGSDTGHWTANVNPEDWAIYGGAANKSASGATAITLANSALDSPPIPGLTYQIWYDFTTTASSSGSITPSFGGTSGVADGQGTSATQFGQIQTITATNTNGLSFSPTSGWYGTITNVFIFPVNNSTPIANFLNSNGTAGIELRSGGATVLGTGLTLGNSFIGYQSGLVNTNGAQNTAVGYTAFKSNSTGAQNTAVGYKALLNNSNGGQNSAFGAQALQNNITGLGNTALGFQALLSNAAGGQNTAVGVQALVGNSSGSNNNAIGSNALVANSTGSYNSAFGTLVLQHNTTGNNNIGVGYFTLGKNTTGNNNIALGFLAGFNATGSTNIMLGPYSGFSNTENNKLYIANTGTINPLIGGDFANNLAGINTATPSATFDIRQQLAGSATAGTLPIASVSGSTSFAALIVDNTSPDLTTTGTGALFTASSSGLTRFVIQNNGNVGIGTAVPTAFLTLSTPTGFTGNIFDAQVNGSSKFRIDQAGSITDTTATTVNFSSAALTVASCSGCGGAASPNYFLQKSGNGVSTGGYTALGNLTTDLLVGGLATSSAKFAVLNVNSGTPVASVSAQTGAANSPSLVLSSSGSIQSVANNTLTVGGATTGDIQFKPGNSGSSLYLASNGNVGVGTSNPGYQLEIAPPGNAFARLGITSSAGAGSAIYLGATTGSYNGAITYGANIAGLEFRTGGVANSTFTRLAITNTGTIGIGDNNSSPLATLDIRPNLTTGGTLAIASISGKTSFAALIVDNTSPNLSDPGSGALFTASSSGLTRFVIQNNGNVGIGTSSATSALYVVGQQSIASVTTTDLIASAGTDGTFSFTATGPTTSNGWTLGTNWSTDSIKATAATATPAQTLSTAPSNIIAGTVYQVKFDCTQTSGGFTIQLGFQDAGVTYGTGGTACGTNQIVYVKSAISSGSLKFIPTISSTFSGTIDNVTVKAIASSFADQTIQSSNGSVGPLEFRSGGNNNFNAFIGYQAGFNSITGNQNAFVGYQAGLNNVTGTNNSFFGSSVGTGNTTGILNTFIGNAAGQTNLTGSQNTLIGASAGGLITTGSGNVFLGYNSGYNEGGSNKLYIANNNTGSPLLYGDFSKGLLGLNLPSTSGVPNANPLAALDVRQALTNGGTIPVASVSGKTSFAALVVDNTSGDLFTASSSGLSRFVISNNGNVGIGTTLPANTLSLQTSGSQGIVNLYNGIGTTFADYGVLQVTSAGGAIASGNPRPLAIQPNGGNVGIGTNNPLAVLHVNGGNAPVASISANSVFAGLVVDNIGGTSNAGAIIAASASGATRFVVNNNGNAGFTGSLGVGTLTPGLTLDVVGNARIGTTTSAGDDIIKTTTADFTVSGSTAISTTTTNNQVSLLTNTGGAVASGTLPVGPALSISPNNVGSGAFRRPDGKYFIFATGVGYNLYDTVTNTFVTQPGPPSGNVPGLGNAQWVRPDGKFMFLGPTAATTQIYDPAGFADGGNYTQITIAAAAAGAFVFQRPDGKSVINVGAVSGTQIYDPVTNSVQVGPSLTAVTANGSVVFQRPDGKWVIFVGGATTGNIYDPVTNTFSTTGAPTLTAANGAGSHAFQLPNGKFMIIIGGGSGVGNLYDPVANTMTSVSLNAGDTAGAGALTVQRADGKFYVILGGASNKTDIYDPANSANGTFTAGPLLSANAGAGAFAFQRNDGKYIIVHGGGVTTTSLLDAGWNTNGSWESEQINNTKISTYSAMLWNSYPQNTSSNSTTSANIQYFVKTATTQGGLGSAVYQTIKDSGDTIQAVWQASWVQIKAQLQMPLPTFYSGNKGYVVQSNIWSGSGGTAYYRVPSAPSIFDLRIQNPIAAYGGMLDPDPTQGKNEATNSAILDGVVTDNTNRLMLALYKNSPSSTASAGIQIASASANFGAATGVGGHAIQMQDGRFLAIAGGNSTTSRIYNPASGNFDAGPPLCNPANTGAYSFQLPDGRYLTVLGGSTTNTCIYDPINNIFYVGPSLPIGATAGTGGHAIQRQDGKFLIVYGNSTNYTALFDPVLLSFTPGPFVPFSVGFGGQTFRLSNGRHYTIAASNGALYDSTKNAFTVATSPGIGISISFQRQDGKMITIAANGGPNAEMFDPSSVTVSPFTANIGEPSSPNAGDAGQQAIQMPDGRFLLLGVAQSTVTWIYDPVSNAIITGPPLPTGITAGAFSFQRTDGKFVVVTPSGNTMIIDAGWNLTGSYITEPISAPSLSSNTALYWKNVAGGALNVKYKTSSTQIGLGQAGWLDAPVNGTLLTPGTTDSWAQVRFEFQSQLPDFPGAKARVWLSASSSQITYYRTMTSPILQYWKLANTGDPNILTLTSGGLNVFRFTQDGQAYTSAQGAWNSGGADLAERYTSLQTLEPGDVVSLDQTANHNVKKSLGQYENDIVGVVSTDPGFVAGAYTENSYPIGLIGRVPVKISNENGDVHFGDVLTSGSIPGYAMKATKAGKVLGKAMEDLSPDKMTDCPTGASWIAPTTKCGTIMMFVNLTDYLGQPVSVAMSESNFGLDATATDSALLGSSFDIQNASQSAEETKILSFLQQQKAKNSGSLHSEVFTDRVSATTDIITPTLIADTIFANHIKANQIEGLDMLVGKLSFVQTNASQSAQVIPGLDITTKLNDFQSHLASIDAQLSLLSQGSTLSAQFANLMNQQPDVSGVSFNAVTSGGLTLVEGNLRVKGNGIIEGILTVVDTINVHNLLVNNIADFMNNVVFHKDVFFQGHQTVSADSAGIATIQKGEQKVDVSFGNAYDTIPVVTMNLTTVKLSNDDFAQKLKSGVCDKTSGIDKCQEAADKAVLGASIHYVVTNRSEKGFTILLDKKVEIDTSFSWTAVGVSASKVQSDTSVQPSAVNTKAEDVLLKAIESKVAGKGVSNSN